MRYAVLADIHANLAAFKAVLQDLESKGGVDEIWCLGDTVGYGPEPHACLELLASHNHVCVAGNHDWAAIGKIDTLDFNPDAARACQWTARQLTVGDIDYLQGLPLQLERGDFTLVHGSPREPIWEYLLSAVDARANFACFDTRFCFVGHSHVPLVFRRDEAGSCILERLSDKVSVGMHRDRLIINPGGVGQPRDGDPRASYAVYDSNDHTIYHYRVEYDIAATQNKMMECQLPLSLVFRLSGGY